MRRDIAVEDLSALLQERNYIWLRASQAEWAENPLGKELELEEFRASVLGDDELIAKQAE